MKNNVKRVLALAVVFVFCLSLCAFGAQPKTFSLRIEGCTQTYFSGDVEVPDDGILWTAVKAVLEDNGIEYVAGPSYYGGIYVSSIGTDTEGAFGGYEGWMSILNGASTTTLDAQAVAAGDDVVIYYGDYSGTLAPIVSVYPEKPEVGEDVTITVTAQTDNYDENWNYIGSTVDPVEGATVTFDGESLTTDENGQVVIEAVGKGSHGYSVSKDVEGSYPALIRTGVSKLYARVPLPVKVNQTRIDENTVSVEFTAAEGISDVQITRTILKDNMPVSWAIEERDITDGLTETVELPEGYTAVYVVFTGLDASKPIMTGNMGTAVGAN